MSVEHLESRWIDAFEKTLRLCAVGPGSEVAILSESQSRRVLIDLCEHAAARLGCQVFHVIVPSAKPAVLIPVRSTGASDALTGMVAVVRALAGVTLVLDCTVEGLLRSKELAQILEGANGTQPRVLMISNEHPEILERTVPHGALESVVRSAMRRLRAAHTMRVRSSAGTDLDVKLDGARVGGVWGFCAKPGQASHWPGGLCLAFPARGTVNGTLVLAPGDVNLTFKRYLRDSIELTIKNDYVTGIDGVGLDAELMRSYWGAWGDREAYAVSHVGWGLNANARWDALAFYDKGDCNGTELRAFAGNFLYSTGTNDVAQRHTLGHFDLPMRGCTVSLDGTTVVRDGVVVEEAEAP